MSPDDARHGTYSGSQRHRRDGETPCDPCKAAAAAYMRAWHAGVESDDARQRRRDVGHARNRALTKLAHRYPHLFSRLYTEELDRARGGAA